MGSENEKAIGFFKTRPGQMGAAVGPELEDPLFVDSIIFTDRTSGKFFEMYVDNGDLQIVEVTIP